MHDWFFGVLNIDILNFSGMNSILGLAVGVCGLAFLGYCVYFDNKRRKDPNFKKKLRERKCASHCKFQFLNYFLYTFKPLLKISNDYFIGYSINVIDNFKN